jgi:hypothetical protein
VFSNQASDLYGGGAPRLAGSDAFRRALAGEQEKQQQLINSVADGRHLGDLASRGLFAPEAATTGGDGLSSAVSGLTSGLINRFSGLSGASPSGSSGTPWNFNTGLNFLPSGSSATATNFQM